MKRMEKQGMVSHTRMDDKPSGPGFGFGFGFGGVREGKGKVVVRLP